jgi:hypothetical protein
VEDGAQLRPLDAQAAGGLAEVCEAVVDVTVRQWTPPSATRA